MFVFLVYLLREFIARNVSVSKFYIDCNSRLNECCFSLLMG